MSAPVGGGVTASSSTRRSLGSGVLGTSGSVMPVHDHCISRKSFLSLSLWLPTVRNSSCNICAAQANSVTGLGLPTSQAFLKTEGPDPKTNWVITMGSGGPGPGLVVWRSFVVSGQPPCPLQIKWLRPTTCPSKRKSKAGKLFPKIRQAPSQK